MADDYPDPNGGGNERSSERRDRRRGSLPGGEGAVPPPLATAPVWSTDPVDPAELTMTAKARATEAKVWGLRVSAQHYEVATAMLDVLSTTYRLSQRQAGELVVQFLIDKRFDLDDFFHHHGGTKAPIDIDFFRRQ